MQTTNCLPRPSSAPISATALSVETCLLHATQVAISDLLSLAFSLGIVQTCSPWLRLIVRSEKSTARFRRAAFADATCSTPSPSRESDAAHRDSNLRAGSPI